MKLKTMKMKEKAIYILLLLVAMTLGARHRTPSLWPTSRADRARM